MALSFNLLTLAIAGTVGSLITLMIQVAVLRVKVANHAERLTTLEQR